MRRAVVAAALLAVNCGGPAEREMPQPDQCLRRELFAGCMKSLPSGPVTTRYNDWDEVVGTCADVAYYQSLRDIEQIKLECRHK